jgi:hypothetical protein
MRFYPPIAAGMDPETVADRIERLLNREKDALLHRTLCGT